MAERWFEDFVSGAEYEFGHAEVTEADIFDFARRFDPQPMHVDPASCGSWAFWWADRQRLAHCWADDAAFCRAFSASDASLASPGIDELRWTPPVRPGDVLHLRVTVLEATRSRSKPDRGMLRTLIEALNQNGEVVMSLKPMNLLRCRPVFSSNASGEEGSAREAAP